MRGAGGVAGGQESKQVDGQAAQTRVRARGPESEHQLQASAETLSTRPAELCSHQLSISPAFSTQRCFVLTQTAQHSQQQRRGAAAGDVDCHVAWVWVGVEEAVLEDLLLGSRGISMVKCSATFKHQKAISRGCWEVGRPHRHMTGTKGSTGVDTGHEAVD